ncbi:MAG: hypothetical protein R3C19_20885 [Planctomycetaceae bacterium]
MFNRGDVATSAESSTVRQQDSAATGFTDDSADSLYADNAVPARYPGQNSFVSPQPVVPTANLQQPDFSAQASPRRRGAGLPVISSGPPFGGHALSELNSKAGVPSGGRVKFDAAAIRRFLNEQSANEMSQGTVLDDLPETMDARVVVATPASDNYESPAALATDAARQQTGFTAGDFPAEPPLVTTPPIVVPANTLPTERDDSNGDLKLPPNEIPAANTSPVNQPTMLDRLRGIYDPIESNSRQLFRRPFQKLPTPWSILRDRDTAPELPVQTADVADVVGGDVNASAIAPAAESAAPALLAELIERKRLQLQAWPRMADGSPTEPVRYRQAEIDLRLLYLIANQPGAAIEAVGSLPPSEQDFWQELVLGLSQYRTRETGMSREDHLAVVIGQLNSAVGHAQSLSSLVIRRLDFCSRIDGFGRIEEFPSSDFDPGQPVLIYAELENVGSELRPGGMYATRFSALLQVFRKGDDEPIETIALNDIEDQTATQRRDYYQSFELTIPAHLWASRYEIRLRLRDQVTQRETVGTLEFQVR